MYTYIWHTDLELRTWIQIRIMAIDIMLLQCFDYCQILTYLRTLQLCRDELVRSIKEVQKMNTTKTCNRLIRGVPRYVIPSSYIVMIKQHNSTSELVSVTFRLIVIHISRYINTNDIIFRCHS